MKCRFIEVESGILVIRDREDMGRRDNMRLDNGYKVTDR
jgi:hypothetical protein